MSLTYSSYLELDDLLLDQMGERLLAELLAAVAPRELDEQLVPGDGTSVRERRGIARARRL